MWLIPIYPSCLKLLKTCLSSNPNNSIGSIPKSSDFSIFSDEKIKEIQTKINNRPRKRFDYENPIFVMEKLLFNPEVALMA